MNDRKSDHINLAFQAQLAELKNDKRFYYEPLLSGHPQFADEEFDFLGKKVRAPFWVSSMTGGTQNAGEINSRLAQVCHEFGFGMGLGSCRKLLTDKTYWPDFDLRKTIGDNLPFYANLGIAQIEELLQTKKTDKIIRLVDELQTDGLILHVNLLQEWFQAEGDHVKNPPIDTVKRLLEKIDFPLIVKEVGQGMGPESLRLLLQLPLAAIEFGAFGGTNFSKLEVLRQQNPESNPFEPLASVGHSAFEMVNYIKEIVHVEKNIACKQLIISGGITNFLDGYFLVSHSPLPAVYGQGAAFLKHAQNSYSQLQLFVENQLKGYRLAQALLKVK